MIYVLAAVGAITVAVLLWKAFGAEAISAARGSQQRSAPPVAPDDDPEFLRRLDEQRKAEEE
ncbi:hypothetical protein [Saccharopolyspora griseoalba]|uniref:Secreted protein n=1 Tax=Saccharopolyspora griseoalba TaxID=1431848 RepID=A0ABW2LJ92_9PSEU